MDFQQFLSDYHKLKIKYPLVPTHNARSENCDLGDYIVGSKNSYYCFDNAYCENNVYIFDSFKAINCYDGDYVIESENCYECVDVLKVYHCAYLNYCARIYDSYFCWDCCDSNDLFGCVHLKYKKFCIFNKQYTEVEYRQQVKTLFAKPPEENLAEMLKIAMEFPVTTTLVSHSENSDFGNHIDYSRNMYLCFDTAHCENCAYTYDAHHNKNCFDLFQTFHSESVYECVDCAHLNKSFFMKDCVRVVDCAFCESCDDSHNLFGCVGLKQQEYCILNKKYAKEEYGKIVSEIMDSFRKTGSV